MYTSLCSTSNLKCPEGSVGQLSVAPQNAGLWEVLPVFDVVGYTGGVPVCQ